MTQYLYGSRIGIYEWNVWEQDYTEGLLSNPPKAKNVPIRFKKCDVVCFETQVCCSLPALLHKKLQALYFRCHNLRYICKCGYSCNLNNIVSK